MATRGGNLMIIDDDKAKSRRYADDLKGLDTGGAGSSNGATSSRSFDGPTSFGSYRDTEESTNRGGLPEFTFDKEEAGLVLHFFVDELKKLADLGGFSSREPVVGQPERVIIKCKKEKHVAAVKDSIKKIKHEIQQYPSETIGITDKPSLAEKLPKWDADPTYMLYSSGDSVCVAGPIYDEVKKGVHKLKVELGIIKPTSRSKRGSFNRSQSIPNSNSVTYPSGSSSLYPDLSKEGDSSFAGRGGGFADPDSKDIYVKETLKEVLEFKVYKGSILKLNVDVIVNAANDTMIHGGGVARIISDAAGYELDKESKDFIWRHRKVGVTRNCVTTAGKLNYKGVIHAVGPQWYMYRDDRVRCLDDLYDTVTNVLEVCKERRYRSVAMPAISAGIFGVPKSLCADMYVKAVADYSKRYESFPAEFHVVDIDTEILQLVKDSFQRWREDEKLIDQRNTVPEYLKKHPDPYYGGGSYGSGGHSGRGQGRGYRGNRDFSGNADGRDADNNRDNSGFGSGRGVKEPRSDYDGAGNRRDAVQSRQDGGTGRDGRGSEDNTTSKPSSPLCTVENDAGQKIGRSNIIADCFKLEGHIKVLIYTGSIDKVRDLDAIACAVDATLHPSGRIAKSLEDVGGNRYNDAIGKMRTDHDFRKQQAGYVAVSDAGDLKVKQVIHVVMPRANGERDIPMFKKAMSNVLAMAEKKHFNSIAIPLIGTGTIQEKQWLLDKFCDAYVETMCEFGSQTSHPDLKNIHLINKAQPVCNALNAAFSRVVGKRPKGPMAGRPLPTPPPARRTGSPMHIDEEEEDDDTYERIPADKTSSLSGSMGKAGSSTRNAGASGRNVWGSSFSERNAGRGGNGSGSGMSYEYGIPASGGDDDIVGGDGGIGRGSFEDNKLSGANSAKSPEEKKEKKGNLNILED